MSKVLIIGAGGWGTAMAVLLGGGGANVTLLAHRAEHAQELQRARENVRLLKGVKLPASVDVVSAVADFAAFEWCFCAVPTRFVRSMFAPLAERYPRGLPLISLTKGIEQESLLLPSALLKQILSAESVLALSGPSHAEEVARGLPASVVVAGDASHSESAQKLVSGKTFRAYVTDDLLGVELAGAAKNVVAIAAGILEGLKFGDNAKAALVARGLAEITRLGVALGAKERTFYGLSGVGDLYTTCASPHGRNRAFGLRIGKGEAPAAIIASQAMEVEGYNTAKALRALAGRAGVEMPIVNQACRVLYEGADPREAVVELMTRNLKAE